MVRRNEELRAAITTLLFNVEYIEPTPFKRYAVVRDDDLSRLSTLVEEPVQ